MSTAMAFRPKTLTDPALREFGLLALAEGKAPQWVQLLRAGKFRSDEYGDFEIAREHLLSMKANFDAKVRGYGDGRLPLDYFHDADKTAAGWIDAVELREGDTELWCSVKWTPKAAQMIADGEVRYLSAEFTFDYVPNEGDAKGVGPCLFGGGVTNRPFVKGMEAVAQLAESKRNNAGKAPEEIKMTEAQIKELQDKLAAAESRATAAEAAATASKAEADKAAGDAKAAGEVAALAEKNSAFAKMLAEGSAVEAQRDAFIKGDVAKFASLAVKTNTGAAGNGAGAGEGGKGASGDKKLDEQDQILALAAEIQKANPTLKPGQAIRRVLAEKPELRAAYEKQTNVRVLA